MGGGRVGLVLVGCNQGRSGVEGYNMAPLLNAW